MIFIKFFRDDGFWIVWSIAIMERTVLDDEVVLFLSSRYFLDNQNEQSRLQRNEGSITLQADQDTIRQSTFWKTIFHKLRDT